MRGRAERKRHRTRFVQTFSGRVLARRGEKRSPSVTYAPELDVDIATGYGSDPANHTFCRGGGRLDKRGCPAGIWGKGSYHIVG